MSPFEIVPIGEAHRAEVAGMWVELFTLHAALGAPDALRAVPERLADTVSEWTDLVIRGGDHLGFVALSDTYVGFIAAGIRDRPWLAAPRAGTIGAIWVVPGRRRLGVGRALALTALAELRARRADVVDLHALSCQPDAVSFWRALGFSTCATQMLQSVK